MSFIISNNNRLLLLPSLEKSEPQDHLDNVSIKNLLKADLAQFQFKFNNDSLPNNYAYNNKIQLPRLSISEDTTQKWSIPQGDRSSRSSVFSNESDDDGFSSNEEDYRDDAKDEEEKQPKLVPMLPPSPPSVDTTPTESKDASRRESREPSIESVEIPPLRPATKRSSVVSVEIDDKEAHSHSTLAKSKRQRVGPSCDLCRSKKIKCDAHVEIMEMNVNTEGLDLIKNNEISAPSIISKHLSSEELKHGYKLMYSNEKIIKFHGCSYCEVRNQPCVYERGYTKDDILRYNMARNIKKKKKTSRKKRS